MSKIYRQKQRTAINPQSSNRGCGVRSFVCNQSISARLGALTDGDGRYDKRTVFMDGLVLPRAMSLVGDGVLIAEPPHLWFCRDTNGDGRADQKVEIAKDYGNIDNPEHNANGLMWAMDNWIYSANFNARFRYQGDGRFTREDWDILREGDARACRLVHQVQLAAHVGLLVARIEQPVLFLEVEQCAR